MLIYARVRHGTRSYDIVEMFLSKLFPNRADLVVVDLTYGVGRFYRLARKRFSQLIAVDVERHDWEVKPDVFYQMPCQVFVEKVINGEIALPKPSIVVVDPPWSNEKRGKAPSGTGISSLPYHLKDADSWSIIVSALKLAKHLNTMLMYRYHSVLPCEHIARVDVLVNIMGHKGYVYYGVCKQVSAGGSSS